MEQIDIALKVFAHGSVMGERRDGASWANDSPPAQKWLTQAFIFALCATIRNLG